MADHHQSYDPEALWTYTYKQSNREEATEHRKRLWLEWTLPLAEDVTLDVSPQDRDAHELFAAWLTAVLQRGDEDWSEKGLGGEWLPIYWGVTSPDGNVAEHAPFSPVVHHDQDFLSFFTWPTSVETGEPFNWLRAHVEDQLWRPDKMDNGGFVQEAPGWKPSALQALVHVSHFEALRP